MKKRYKVLEGALRKIDSSISIDESDGKLNIDYIINDIQGNIVCNVPTSSEEWAVLEARLALSIVAIKA